MKAVVLQSNHQLAVQEVEPPALEHPNDVIIAVSAAAICGSDIHAKHGLIPGIAPGTIIGHEFVGRVTQTGTGVERFTPGDRVAVPAATWCGACPACKRNQIQYCHNGGVWGGGEIFGKGLPGAQASFVRVPHADICLTRIPENVDDAQAVFVGDVLSTGYHAALEGHIETGDTVVIFGCGPVGLGALISAWQFGPRQVFAVDMLDNRLSLAAHYGATPIHGGREDVLETVRAATRGQGADVVLEATGNPEAFAQTLKAVRRGGRISIVGLYAGAVSLPLQELVYYGVQISMGLGNLSHMDQLMGLLETGRIDLNPLVTHHFDLKDAIAAYDLFENHKDQCLKVLLHP
ncbi:MAG: alcohol dehydrogenase catalytic domain-containing protein [Pseudomonadota bacterium]